MRNITSIIAGSAIILFALGCGLLGDLGIVVIVDDVNTTMRPQTAVADIQNGSFAVANYELNINESAIAGDNALKKPSEEKQILITFAVDRTATGAEAERGKYTAENIKWFHVYYFKNGGVQKKVLNNMKGSVILPNFRTNEAEIPGAVDIKDGNNSLKGAFFAKKINR